MSEEFEQDVKDFGIILIAVIIVTNILRALMLPFRGAGWKGGVYGFFSISFLLFSLSLETIFYAKASNVWVNECAEVQVPTANVRSKPRINPQNIVKTVHKGEKFCDVTIVTRADDLYAVPEEWVRLGDIPAEYQYMHQSTLHITRKNMGKNPNHLFTHEFTWICIALYCACAFVCIREKMKRRKELMDRIFPQGD